MPLANKLPSPSYPIKIKENFLRKQIDRCRLKTNVDGVNWCWTHKYSLHRRKCGVRGSIHKLCENPNERVRAFDSNNEWMQPRTPHFPWYKLYLRVEDVRRKEVRDYVYVSNTYVGRKSQNLFMYTFMYPEKYTLTENIVESDPPQQHKRRRRARWQWTWRWVPAKVVLENKRVKSA